MLSDDLSDFLPHFLLSFILINRKENVDSAIWTEQVPLNILQGNETSKLPGSFAFRFGNNVCYSSCASILPLFQQQVSD